VPTDTPGVEIERNIGLMGERVPGSGMHALIHYHDVRVPAESLLGGEGQAFVIAQTRLGGGRVHHAMRTVGMAKRALDMLGERAVSRKTRDGVLADKQSVRDYVADSYIELLQFRLLVMYVAWSIDQKADPKAIRRDIAAIKVLTPKVLHDVTQRAIQVHGAIGVSDEMPLGGLWMVAPIMGLVDGPTEVHRNTVARQVLKSYQPVGGLWPSQHLPTRLAAARRKFADHPGALTSAAGGQRAEGEGALEHEVGNL
jgi:acyl-CoA dehydrogenase